MAGSIIRQPQRLEGQTKNTVNQYSQGMPSKEAKNITLEESTNAPPNKTACPVAARSFSPVVALSFSSVHVLISLFSYINPIFLFLSFIFWPVTLLLPIAGVIIGIISLSLGKERIGSKGILISLIAIALPIISVAGTILGVKTGAVVMGM